MVATFLPHLLLLWDLSSPQLHLLHPPNPHNTIHNKEQLREKKETKKEKKNTRVCCIDVGTNNTTKTNHNDCCCGCTFVFDFSYGRNRNEKKRSLSEYGMLWQRRERRRNKVVVVGG